MNAFRSLSRPWSLVSRITSSQSYSCYTLSGSACSKPSGGDLKSSVNVTRKIIAPQRQATVLTVVNFQSLSSEASSPALKERIDKLVKKNKIVVFMKGVPDEPRCGFSNAVVQIFRMHGVSNYDSHNVLEDESIRQGIKDYSNWPTIPQVYINGEFVGGCDILIEMHKNGELVEQLSKVGIKSALLEQEQSKTKDDTSKK